MGQDLPNIEAAHSGHYRFDDVEVDAVAYTLRKGDEPRAIEPKAFAVLLALLRRPGELIARDELLDQVWGHRHVTPGVLTRAIAQLRAALGDDPQHPRYIQTRHALGYSFVGELLNAGDCNRIEGHSDTVAQNGPPDAVLAFDGMNDATGAAATAPVRGGRHRHWRFRHWVVASAVAILLFAVMAWNERRPEARRPGDPSVAVMPFTNLGLDRSTDYFAKGLAVEMHDALASVGGLKVAAYMEPAAAAAREPDVQELGRRLGVATVLDASVRRDGERLRINARLTDTATGYTLWSRSYERADSDVFATQSEIANEVVQALVGTMQVDRDRIDRRLAPTSNVAAFDSYLKGLWQLRQAAEDEDASRAIGHFRDALAKDSGFARAQAALCRTELWKFESRRNASAFDDAEAACQKAASMDGSAGEVDLALGDLHRISGNAEQASRYYNKLLNDPALLSEAMIGLAQLHVDDGREDLAMAEFRKALAARPADAQVYAEMGYQQYRLGRYEEAIESYRKVVALQPDVAQYWRILGGLLVNGGDGVEAESALMRSVKMEPQASAYANLGELRLRKRDYSGAAGMYREAIRLNSDYFLYHGYLADALSVDPGATAEANAEYAEATKLARAFVSKKQDDAMAIAALGWYLANLGERELARQSAMAAEALHLEPGEVAFFNAQTLALLGEHEEARRRIARALEAGVAQARVSSSPILQPLGLPDPGHQM